MNSLRARRVELKILPFFPHAFESYMLVSSPHPMVRQPGLPMVAIFKFHRNSLPISKTALSYTRLADPQHSRPRFVARGPSEDGLDPVDRRRRSLSDELGQSPHPLF